MSTTVRTIDVEANHLFGASPEQVYDIWLDPAQVPHWFGPGLGTTLPVELNARVGGHFRIVQVREGLPVGHSGQYLALERPRFLAFSWGLDDHEQDSKVKVLITPVSDGTQVRVIHTVDQEWSAYSDSIQHSWRSMMAEMARLLAG